VHSFQNVGPFRFDHRQNIHNPREEVNESQSTDLIMHKCTRDPTSNFHVRSQEVKSDSN